MAGGGTTYNFTVTFPTRNEAPCGAIVKIGVTPWANTYLLLFNAGFTSAARQEPSYIYGGSYYQSGDLGVRITSLIDGSCTIQITTSLTVTQSDVHIAPVFISDLDTILNS